MHKGTAAAGANGSDVLCVHVDAAADKARADVAALDLGQLAAADHDVLLGRAFACGVVDHIPEVGDHSGVAVIAGGRAADYKARETNVAVGVKISRAARGGHHPIVHRQAAGHHVIAQVARALRAGDHQIPGAHFDVEIACEGHGPDVDAALGLQVHAQVAPIDAGQAANIEVDVARHPTFLRNHDLWCGGGAGQGRGIEQQDGQIAFLQAAAKGDLAAAHAVGGPGKAQCKQRVANPVVKGGIAAAIGRQHIDGRGGADHAIDIERELEAAAGGPTQIERLFLVHHRLVVANAGAGHLKCRVALGAGDVGQFGAGVVHDLAAGIEPDAAGVGDQSREQQVTAGDQCHVANGRQHHAVAHHNAAGQGAQVHCVG